MYLVVLSLDFLADLSGLVSLDLAIHLDLLDDALLGGDLGSFLRLTLGHLKRIQEGKPFTLHTNMSRQVVVPVGAFLRET